MILGIDQILKLVKNKGLVSNLSRRELSNPEGAGFDLRIDELYAIAGQGFLGVKERQTPKLKLVARYAKGRTNKVSLKPKEYYVMTTVEKVNVPGDLLILFYPRSTLYRSGVTIFSGNASPGYRGALTFGIVNLGKHKFELEMGARVAHAIFYKVKGKTGLYRGQWQEGRVSTKGKKETQA